MSSPIKQQLHGLESIIASDLPFSVKEEPIRNYRKVLASSTGVTLEVLDEIKNVLGRKGLSERQCIRELGALEKVFIQAAKKTHREEGKLFFEAQWRKEFKGFVNAVYGKMQQERMIATSAAKRLREMRQGQRKAGGKPLPWRQKPK